MLFPVIFIFKKSRNHLNDVRNVGYVFFLEKKAPARNAPVVVLGGSSENRRMSLPEIEKTPRIPL